MTAIAVPRAAPPPPEEPPIDSDAVVIGAGPVGLFQVFQLGLQEMRADLIDALPHPGGQCAELYPDKPIYDIPALPVCSGADLTARLQQQVQPFSPRMHLLQQVASLGTRDDGRFHLATTAGRQFIANAVFIAAGAGAFVPRSLQIEGLRVFDGCQVFHRADADLLAQQAGRHVVIVGDGDAALHSALALAGDDEARAASVTLVHRRDAFRASPALVAAVQARRAAGRLLFKAGQITGMAAEGGTLRQLLLSAPDGSTVPLPLDTLLVLLGLSPKLGPIADWGLALERRQIAVDTATFETSVPGIYAVGDINTYPGKRKLIVCGFHEATLAAFAAAARARPALPVQLQYTTTSSRLHQLLGVAPPTPGAETG